MNGTEKFLTNRNPLFFAILSLIISAPMPTRAADQVARSSFRFKTRLGFQQSHEILVLKNEVKVDGETLSQAQLSSAAPYLTRLLSAKERSGALSMECAAGTYIHTVTLKGKTQREDGCLEGPEFKELQLSFKALIR